MTADEDRTERFVKRFDGRADVYSRYRPRYPPEVLQTLEEEIGFNRKSVVADIGSGTGILSELFLENGNVTYGVEPNGDMRKAAEKNLKRYLPRFISINGTAEATNLNDDSIDLAAVGQALHWFDLKKARGEFQRILKRRGYVFIVYNYRKKEEGANEAYAELTGRFAKNKADVPHVKGAYVAKFLKNSEFRRFVIPNYQALDLKGMLGRLASASYAPPWGSPEWIDVEKDMHGIFDEYGHEGVVTLHYDTTLYLGKFASQVNLAPATKLTKP